MTRRGGPSSTRARKGRLPASYHETIDAVERYALRFGPATDEAVVTMLEDLVEIFEQGTKEGHTINHAARAEV